MKVGMFNSLRGGAARFAESVKKYNGDIEFVDLDWSTYAGKCREIKRL